ncbi:MULTISPECIES: hypothetical protein [Halorussus]|uniref:hypothetical protein n=1 Tax=Halorussus TaxID=1070314 RepID=UPI0013B35FAF|nr:MULTISPECIES: hypothetical protein [Halorussus]NHN60555.1 hypothetical protein [Halorussus sp. JP-T4]
MARLVSYRTQMAISFVASLVAGRSLSKHDDGGERLRVTVLANLAGTLGMILGYKLAGGGD